jgi:hypothetical protein
VSELVSTDSGAFGNATTQVLEIIFVSFACRKAGHHARRPAPAAAA